MRQTESLTRCRMNHNRVLHECVDRSHNSGAGARPPRSLYRNVRVVDAGVMDDSMAVQSPHKAQQVQSGKDDAE